MTKHALSGSNLDSSNLDHLVETVLEQLYLITDLDPACIEPDARLHFDLNIHPTDISKIFSAVAQILKVQRHEMCLDFQNLTLRDTVAYFKKMTSATAA